MLMLLLACADPADDPGVAAVLELEGVVVDGGLVFAANCQACHGEDAKGNEVGPDLVEHLGHHEDAEFIETILYGGFGQMGAYEDILEDQEIADVMAWLHDR
jgi:mono/diheme cytochrome c family protein